MSSLLQALKKEKQANPERRVLSTTIKMKPWVHSGLHKIAEKNEISITYLIESALVAQYNLKKV